MKNNINKKTQDLMDAIEESIEKRVYSAEVRCDGVDCVVEHNGKRVLARAKNYGGDWVLDYVTK